MWNPVQSIKEALERKMIKTFLVNYVMHWKNVIPVLFTILSFLEPSIRAYDVANPHTFLAQVFTMLIWMLHTSAPKDKIRGGS